MKTYAFILLFFLYYVECRKAVPINKNANIDFINMEAAVRPDNVRPTPVPVPIAGPSKPVAPVSKPQPIPQPVPQPKSPSATTAKPIVQPKPLPTQNPTLITPKPVNPVPVAQPISTPGPGNVKQLITFYDSQGKASPIRPYSYSQAVKQG
ncbi:alpha carbonic anhydrase 8-like [Melitaea cinxia]|uniref:alpha carbonic anhydrase 8-like n=1 Tax=Melitaea cinxia TaxID=113334 RepID=UPI001E273C36|nr:alpha carbonic anhydrase 8-like [Melitaea cinxia]